MQALAPLARLRRKVRFDNSHVLAIMKFVKVIILYYRKVNTMREISMKSRLIFVNLVNLNRKLGNKIEIMYVNM